MVMLIVYTSIPSEEVLEEQGNKVSVIYRKVVDDAYKRLGNKLDEISKNVESDEPGIEICDKKRNKLYGLYKSKNYLMKKIFDENGNKLSGSFNQMENKKGNKIQALYRKNDINVPGEELYDKNGNKLYGTYLD